MTELWILLIVIIVVCYYLGTAKKDNFGSRNRKMTEASGAFRDIDEPVRRSGTAGFSDL